MKKNSAEAVLMRRIERRFAKGVVEYGLIEEGDVILVGLSGGKDSLALLELLARRSRIHKPAFRVVAAHVVMENIPYQSDEAYLRQFAEGLGVPFVVERTGFDASTDHRKSPCFLCSWNRRKALFTVAKSQGCNKIALGHHMDDFLQTLLMNITFQGAFSAMTPRLVMKKFDMTIIRPLCLVHEADLVELAACHGYRKQIKNCPYEHDSHRAAMKGIFQQLEAMNPEARYSLWGSMTNIQSDLLPPSHHKDQQPPLLHKDKIDGQDQADEGRQVVPMERLSFEEHGSKDREDNQGNHLLDNFELH